MSRILIDLTPPEHQCKPLTPMCPAVLRAESSHVIIGRVCGLSVPEIQNRCGPGEGAVEIAADVLEGALGIRPLTGYDDQGRLVVLSVPFDGGQLSCAFEGDVHVHKRHRGKPETDLSWTHIHDTEKRKWTRNCAASPQPDGSISLTASDGSKWWRAEVEA